MMMHKNQPSVEAGSPPDMTLIQEMGKFVGEHAKAGRLLDGAGLAASKTRSRLTFEGGKATIQHGPYAGERELASELHVIKVGTREEALRWAERYGDLLSEGEIELGKITEPWDLGLVPVPADPPLQMLLVEKADAATESGGRGAQQKAALDGLRREMKAAGVLTRSIRLAPSSNAKRLNFEKNKMTVKDGPFIESKELIGGFIILELPSFDEAIEQSRRYAAILGGDLEMDVRVVDESP